MKLCLSLHYDGTNSFLFVNSTEIRKYKVKDSEIVTTPLKNISKDWSVGNMKRTGLMVMFMILVLIMILLQLMIY